MLHLWKMFYSARSLMMHMKTEGAISGGKWYRGGREGGEGALVEWRGEAARWSMWDTQAATTCIAPEHISGTCVISN